MEVTRTVTSWAEEPIVQRRREAREQGLADQIIAQNRHYGLYSQVPYAEGFREFFAVETKSRALKHLPI